MMLQTAKKKHILYVYIAWKLMDFKWKIFAICESEKNSYKEQN